MNIYPIIENKISRKKITSKISFATNFRNYRKLEFSSLMSLMKIGAIRKTRFQFVTESVIKIFLVGISATKIYEVLYILHTSVIVTILLHLCTKMFCTRCICTFMVVYNNCAYTYAAEWVRSWDIIAAKSGSCDKAAFWIDCPLSQVDRMVYVV